MARSKQKNNSLIFEELEPRLLFSADGVEALAADAVEQTLEEQPIIIIEQETQEQAVEPESVQSESADVQPDSGQDKTNGGDENTSEQEVTDEQNDEAVVDGGETPASENEASSDAVTDFQEEVQSSELVLINGDVNDYEQLVTDIEQSDDRTRSIEVVILDDEQDGLDQVSTILDESSNLDAIHIITHGSDGSFALGSDWLDNEDLLAGSDTISAWAEALSEDADILLYGCNIAADADGQNLTDTLAELTGADVAASDDMTGNATLGGDWELEYETGSIEASIAVSQEAQVDWGHLLIVINTSFQEGNGNGYNSTVDTFLNEGSITQDNSTTVGIEVDLDDGGTDKTTQGLIRFDDIFGTGTGQVPDNVMITSATLTVNVNNVSNSAATISIHEMLTGWTDTDTWSSTGGILIDDIEAANAADSILSNPGTFGSVTFTGLEDRIQSWLDGASTNNGWLFSSDNDNGWYFDSSESGRLRDKDHEQDKRRHPYFFRRIGRQRQIHPNRAPGAEAGEAGSGNNRHP